MDTGESNKKVNLEELSKEELLKKCRGLLLIAQKAKQAKDALKEENNKLKEEFSTSTDASQELIEKLTQQKLSLVTTIEDLKQKNSSCDDKFQVIERELRVFQDKFNSADNENVSYKRQVTRLTNENEQLISHLDSLEKQIDELNQIGTRQQKQLLELEKNRVLENTYHTDNKITELQNNVFSVSLEEMKELKTSNTLLHEKLEDLQNNLLEKNKHILLINEELKLKCDILDRVTNELTELKTLNKNNELISINEKLTLRCNELANTVEFLKSNSALSEKQERDEELQLLKGELTKKLMLYDSKIIEFAYIAKTLKKEKKELFTLYTDQILSWKDELNIAGQELVAKVSLLDSDNIKLKECIKKFKAKDDRNEIERNTHLGTINEYKNQIEVLHNEKVYINNELNSLRNLSVEVKDTMQENNKLKTEIEKCKNECSLLTADIENISEIHERSTNEIDDRIRQFEQLVTELKAQLKSYETDKEHTKATEIQLAEQSSKEIQKLVQENKELLDLNNHLTEKLDKVEQSILNKVNSEIQTDDQNVPSSDLEELLNLKQENAELLSEMNEMNQAIKERGENISSLEAHCEQIKKKLQIYETQANKNVENITQKDEIINNLTKEVNLLKGSNCCEVNLNGSDSNKDEEISQLRNEIETLQEKLNSTLDTSYAESDTMSTSTFSRNEENNRLKDLEGSWEERYGKLRNLAIKLKGKIRELTSSLIKEQNEKEEFQKKNANNMKTIQTLQNQSDKLEDDLEKVRAQNKECLNRLATVAEEILKDKELILQRNDIIADLKKENEALRSEKETTENWKKQVSGKVQTLRKDLEANNVLKKEYELKISKLTADIENKEQILKVEIENHKQTKNLLDQSNNECKKNSVLSLEMQDYERSVKETSKKLEKHQDIISKLKGQIDSQKSTINALREQNKLLEERIDIAEGNLKAGECEIISCRKHINALEEEIRQKEDKVQSITQLLETSRSENEELSTELSKVIAEHQKANNILKSERDDLRSRTLGLQQSLRDVQDALKLKEEEFAVVKDEYEGYRVRAQSVLRQNQNRDVGLEDKLSEEVTTLKEQNVTLNTELKESRDKTDLLEHINECLASEKDDYQKKVHDLENEIEEIRNQYSQLVTKYQKSLNEHAETTRSLKVHADTLSQCYRQQLSEQEVRHNREIIELQSRIEKTPSPIEQLPVLPTMTREDGEGSESIESTNATNLYPVPLERLLASESDQETTYMKKQLNELESKLAHLTALLSDTEQDLAKHVQMNKLLKEEIRRQQRSVEREKHAENLEYLKNVIFKFITLHSGDEKSRLVPVLNTILKLSPEENSKLNLVARGDSGIKGWTNYLPTWTSPNKP